MESEKPIGASSGLHISITSLIIARFLSSTPICDPAYQYCYVTWLQRCPSYTTFFFVVVVIVNARTVNASLLDRERAVSIGLDSARSICLRCDWPAERESRPPSSKRSVSFSLLGPMHARDAWLDSSMRRRKTTLSTPTLDWAFDIRFIPTWHLIAFPPN